MKKKEMVLFGSKKANVVMEAMTIIIIIVVFALVNIFGSSVFDEINTDIQTSDMTNESKAISQNSYSSFAPLFDSLFVFIFVLLLIFVIVASVFVDSHPIYFIVSIILIIILSVTTILIGNVYNDVMQESTISSYANEFTYTSWIMQHILELSIVLGFIVIITLYIKLKVIN